MTRFAAVAVLALAAVTAPAQASTLKVTAFKRIAPRVVELTIQTSAFTVPTHVDVDLPTDYDAKPRKLWPVTYAR
jgi:hypothetical protein